MGELGREIRATTLLCNTLIKLPLFTFPLRPFASPRGLDLAARSRTPRRPFPSSPGTPIPAPFLAVLAEKDKRQKTKKKLWVQGLVKVDCGLVRNSPTLVKDG